MTRARLVAVLLLAVTAASVPASTFVNFESGHVRPLAFVDLPVVDLLLAVNTPDDRLAVYTTSASGLNLVADVPVGLEPVAVAARQRADGTVQAWVVNHLSDSVSLVLVDPLDPGKAHVTRTLLVGDEPRDVVLAGPSRDRLFVTAAHRGQNGIADPQLTTEGLGRADVWVFDTEAPGAALGGSPLAVIALPGDTPRALAATPDGSTVWAAVFLSGNRTTSIPHRTVDLHGGLPAPPADATALTTTPPPPDTGLIVRWNPATGQWEDEEWRDWDPYVPFQLPDEDVFRIDATASPPARATGASAIGGVGTVLFNLAVRPGTGALYAANLEARNQIRFEPTLLGHITESRVTVIHDTTPTPVDLNPHVNYATTPGPAAEIAQTLAFPTDMAFSSDGKTLYVAAFGSGAVAVLDAALLEAGLVLPRDQIAVGLGPSGLALDGPRDRLYVMNRLDHSISVVANVSTPALRSVAGVVPLPYSAESPIARAGRRFLYDARATSAHGDAACASCHIFGDFDGIAWDLGNPYGMQVTNPNPMTACSNGFFHPMKGPMTTQSFRGMDGAGPLHWRGDRTGQGLTTDGYLDEHFAFEQFNGAFPKLLGRPDGELDPADMTTFADFALSIRYPPNPVRALDNGLTGAQAGGLTTFIAKNKVISGQSCNDCHALPLGTSGLSSCDAEPQDMKVPHLRNLYQKVGRFGMPPDAIFGIAAYTVGPQVRGFGFIHDGSVSALGDFLDSSVFILTPTERDDLVAFLLSFDTGFAPAVGQQVTVTPSSATDATVASRITLLMTRADAGDCDLVVKGLLAGVPRGWLHDGSTGTGLFRSDAAADPTLPEATLRAQAAVAGQERTYTCVPPGSGVRIGIDHDDDGNLDHDEAVAGTPLDFPTSTTTSSTTSTTSSTLAPSTTSTTSSTTSTTSGKTGTIPKLHLYKWRPPIHLPHPPDPGPFHP